MEITLFTLGTSNRTIEEFLEILDFYHIKKVIDVRHWPTSKLFPHFKKENLEQVLKEKKIDYYHLEDLGGFREGGYENYVKTEKFKKALERLAEIAKEGNSLVICAERFPWKCHRIFVARELEKFGYKVLHIIEKEKIWDSRAQPKKVKPTCEKRNFSLNFEKKEKIN